MKDDRKMVLGYIAGGLLVIVLVPSAICIATTLVDKVCRIQIIQNPTLRWSVAAVLLAAGLVYGVWSVVVQNTVGEGGPLEIGGLEVSPKTRRLVVSGPYRYTRNPMLFGTFLMYFALALSVNSLASVAIVIAIFAFMLTVVVKMEEKRLLRDFGGQYEEYRRRVPMFIPWFRRKGG